MTAVEPAPDTSRSARLLTGAASAGPVVAILSGVAAVVGDLLGMTFPLAFLAIVGWLVALATSLLVVIVALLFALLARQSRARLRVLARSASCLALTILLVVAGFGLREPLQDLAFRLRLPARTAAAEWALSESHTREFNPYGEKLPPSWRHLSDGGEVIVIDTEPTRSVMFFKFRGILDGTAWLYTTDPSIANEQLGDAVEVAPGWWEGDS